MGSRKRGSRKKTKNPISSSVGKTKAKNGPSQDSGSRQKKEPWEWTDSERVAARLDPAPYELRVKQAQADLDAARSAGASVKKLEAQLAQAQADLERSVIRAPVDGIVVLRNVDAGQSIAEAPPQVLFAIAPDLREMQVEASIDAADVGRVRVGMPASFSVEAFPRRTFSGEIRYIRKSPQSPASYTLVIAAANPDLALVPGMTANVRVALAEPDAAAGSSAPTRP